MRSAARVAGFGYRAIRSHVFGPANPRRGPQVVKKTLHHVWASLPQTARGT